MSEFLMQDAPTIETVSVENAVMEPVEQRVGPMLEALEERGMTVNDFFGGNDPRIDASITQGDWGQEDRGMEAFVPPQPPVPGQHPGEMYRPGENETTLFTNPQQGPAVTQYGHVDPRTSSPYDDASIAPPAPVQPLPQQGGAPMTREQYLAATGNAPGQAPAQPPAMFGPPRTAQEAYANTEMGNMRNELGELKSMLAQVIANGAGGGDPTARFAAEIGLDAYEADHMLTAGELTTILGTMAGSMYNETRDMVKAAAPSPAQGNPQAEAVRAHMVARYPWLGSMAGQAQDAAIADMLGSGGAPTPPIPPGSQSVQHHAGGQRPATFVERGSSVTQQDMGAAPRQRRGDMADMVLAKKARGEHVTTNELGAALRSRGIMVPVRR